MTDPSITPEAEINAQAVSERPESSASADEPTEPVVVAADAAQPIDTGISAVPEAERLLAEQKDKYVRLLAEFENFRKRSVRERQEAESRGMAYLVSGLLDALDDLGRVAHVDAAATPAQSIVDGVAMVEKKLLKSLSGHGLVLVNPDGERFDPAVHEAISATPAALPEEDERVAQVFQVGYTFNGQLLRPARVLVKQWHG